MKVVIIGGTGLNDLNLTRAVVKRNTLAGPSGIISTTSCHHAN